jgi:hypothetical protein
MPAVVVGMFSDQTDPAGRKEGKDVVIVSIKLSELFKKKFFSHVYPPYFSVYIVKAYNFKFNVFFVCFYLQMGLF